METRQGRDAILAARFTTARRAGVAGAGAQKLDLRAPLRSRGREPQAALPSRQTSDDALTGASEARANELRHLWRRRRFRQPGTGASGCPPFPADFRHRGRYRLRLGNRHLRRRDAFSRFRPVRLANAVTRQSSSLAFVNRRPGRENRAIQSAASSVPSPRIQHQRRLPYISGAAIRVELQTVPVARPCPAARNSCRNPCRRSSRPDGIRCFRC